MQATTPCGLLRAMLNWARDRGVLRRGQPGAHQAVPRRCAASAFYSRGIEFKVNAALLEEPDWRWRRSTFRSP